MPAPVVVDVVVAGVVGLSLAGHGSSSGGSLVLLLRAYAHTWSRTDSVTRCYAVSFSLFPFSSTMALLAAAASLIGKLLLLFVAVVVLV